MPSSDLERRHSHLHIARREEDFVAFIRVDPRSRSKTGPVLSVGPRSHADARSSGLEIGARCEPIHPHLSHRGPLNCRDLDLLATVIVGSVGRRLLPRRHHKEHRLLSRVVHENPRLEHAAELVRSGTRNQHPDAGPLVRFELLFLAIVFVLQVPRDSQTARVRLPPRDVLQFRWKWVARQDDSLSRSLKGITGRNPVNGADVVQQSHSIGLRPVTRGIKAWEQCLELCRQLAALSGTVVEFDEILHPLTKLSDPRSRNLPICPRVRLPDPEQSEFLFALGFQLVCRFCNCVCLRFISGDF